MKPELVALIFGVMLAVFAGLLKLLKNYSFRKQEKLSVHPSLKIDREIQSDKPIKIILHNSGVGSAYLDNFSVYANRSASENKVFSSLYEAVANLGLNSSDVICYSPSKNEEIPPNSSKILFEANPINSADHAKICAALPALSFKINYSSIYDEKFQL